MYIAHAVFCLQGNKETAIKI